MIKLINLLKEVTVQKKTSLGAGDEQSAYPYLKDPNYVIKKFHFQTNEPVSNKYEMRHYLNIQQDYPKHIAKIIIPNKDSKYYFQEKIDVEKSQNDIWDTVIKVINKVILNLEKKYNTPLEAAEDLDLPDIFHQIDDWEDFKDINNIDDIFSYGGTETPMSYLFNEYIYDNYSKNIPLVQKLKPVWDIGSSMTNVGVFHEDNLGYDKNGNFKIIDI